LIEGNHHREIETGVETLSDGQVMFRPALTIIEGGNTAAVDLWFDA
jgi:hypothetical protein